MEQAAFECQVRLHPSTTPESGELTSESGELGDFSEVSGEVQCIIRGSTNLAILKVRSKLRNAQASLATHTLSPAWLTLPSVVRWTSR